MNILKNKNFLEYLSLCLVLSFLIFHKVLLIIAGMIIALYCKDKLIESNILKIENKVKVKSDKLKSRNEDRNDNKNIDKIIKSSDDRLLQLVEETGFIPNINDNESAA